jgi:peptide/nickel transport system permease protein
LIIIALLVILSIYALVTIPYQEAIRLWRGGVGVWDENPRTAAPAWTNFFRRDDLPATTVLNTEDGTAVKVVEDNKDTIIFEIDYPYQGFPQDLIIFYSPTYIEKPPLATLIWTTPDGREINMGNSKITQGLIYYASQDEKLKRKFGGVSPQEGLFMDPNAEEPTALPGTYQLKIVANTFEEGSDLDARLVLVGKVHGIAGTDHQRRDLSLPLIWGTPVALAFGLLAAIGTTVATMIIAAVSTWYGGWIDNLIQRITEINLVLPFLPILIMVGTFYSRSIWLMLGITILLSIFGGAIKNYRSIFLQIKEASYIEAAKAYGADNLRIITNYLVPRIIPLIIPALVTLIPTYVFLEASLAVLGLGDPVLPTWGKVINDAQSNGALYQGYYYWVLQPTILLMITGLAFALVGFALDRIFNPRLRNI